jgi:hypothetical protein
MKNNLIEEDIIRIKKLIKNVLNERFELIKDENIITEQVYPLLTKYLSKGVASKLETSMGDDVMKNLESLFARSEVNFAKNSLGKIVVKSASGTEVEMRTISAALDAVSKGTMKVDDVVKLLPRKLKDGTDFRTIIDSQLKNAKPKPKPTPNTNTNTTGGSSTSSNSLAMPNPKTPTSIPNPNNISRADIDAIIKRNVSNPRFEEFMLILDEIPMSDKVRNIMINSFDTVGKDPIKAMAYARELSQQLNEQKYGWIKRLLSKGAKDPSKTISIAGKTIATGTFWYVTVIAVLSLGGLALGWVNYIKKALPEAPKDEKDDLLKSTDNSQTRGIGDIPQN